MTGIVKKKTRDGLNIISIIIFIWDNLQKRRGYESNRKCHKLFSMSYTENK